MTEWRELGQLMLAAFEHISVINLPRSVERRQQMVSLLEGTLSLRHGIDYSFTRTVDCAEYGRWPLDLVQVPKGASKINLSNTAWWLHRRSCKSHGDRHQMGVLGGCLRTEFQHCRDFNAGRECGGVCYTLSVAAALQQFLRTNRSRMLLLEDDLCLTEAMQLAAPALLRLTQKRHVKGRVHWSIARLAFCNRKVKADDENNATKVTADDLKCAELSTRAGQRVPVTIARPTVHARAGGRGVGPAAKLEVAVEKGAGKAFCAHAFGIDRLGAERLLRLSLPVTSYFDDIFFALGGGFGASPQRAMLEIARVPSPVDLHAVHLSNSVFAQNSTVVHIEVPE